MKGIFVIAAVAMLQLSSTQARAEKEKVVLAAGGTLIHYVEELGAGFTKATGIEIENLSKTGMSGDAITVALDASHADAGLVASNKDEKIKLLKSKSLNLKKMDQIQTSQIGMDRIAVIAHKGSPAKLEKEELKKLFTGKATNWKDVGGSDTPVKIGFATNSPVTMDFLLKNLLDGEPMVKETAKVFPNSQELAKWISATPGAISFTSYSKELPNQFETYTPKQLSRPIYIETIGTANPKVAKLIDYLKANLPQ